MCLRLWRILLRCLRWPFEMVFMRGYRQLVGNPWCPSFGVVRYWAMVLMAPVFCLKAILDFGVDAVSQQPVIPIARVVVCAELVDPAQFQGAVAAREPAGE